MVDAVSPEIEDPTVSVIAVSFFLVPVASSHWNPLILKKLHTINTLETFIIATLGDIAMCLLMEPIQ